MLSSKNYSGRLLRRDWREQDHLCRNFTLVRRKDGKTHAVLETGERLVRNFPRGIAQHDADAIVEVGPPFFRVGLSVCPFGGRGSPFSPSDSVTI